MTPQRAAVERLFYAALALPSERRAAFLADACPDDPVLREEVETLLGDRSRDVVSGALALADAHSRFGDGAHALIGSRLGRLTIRATLDSGGEGEVFRAYDATLGRDVAIRILPDVFAAAPGRIARIEREAALLASLNHPNIAALHRVEHADGKYALVLELVEGETLAARFARARMQRRAPEDAAALWPSAVAVLVQVARALVTAHAADLVHGDLGPQNIAVDVNGTVKVLDFCRERPFLSGTVRYLSPEQASARPLTPATDIYSLAIVAYELLTGQHPFGDRSALSHIAALGSEMPEPPSRHVPGLPATLDDVIIAMLDRDPARRPAAMAVAHTLEAIQPRTSEPVARIGASLGVYEIVGFLGRGGMGEVYRARDPRLRRDVAIEILPATAANPQRMARFEQEARAAAALNHPNILAVYDVGQHEGVPYIVSELLEGDTLRERLAGGLLPLRKALDYAIAMAQGLAAAHEKGIIHRDLKPENVVITADERVKILDFGLAKLTQPEPGMTTRRADAASTQAGMVLGTVGYMAPEQVRGRPADHRSDIFSLGVVLHEMLAGRRPFQRATDIDTMAAILDAGTPGLPLAERQIPPAIGRIVSRCLEKNPAARFKSADDLSFALETLSLDAYAPPAPGVVTPVVRNSGVRRLLWIAAGLAVVLAAALGGSRALRPPAAAPVVRFQVGPPEGGIFPGGNNTPRMAISPDGQYLVFALDLLDNTPTRLWLRRLDSLDARALVDTEAPLQAIEPVQGPFWSRDSRHIGFFADGRLRRVDVATGSLETLARDLPGNNFGGTWNAEDVIVFGGSDLKGLRRMSASGGVSTQVTTLDTQAGESAHLWPEFLPDGRHFLYFAMAAGTDVRAVYVGSLDSPERTLVLKSEYMAHFAPPDQLAFVRDGALLVQQFDTRTFQLRGEPVQVVDAVQGYPANGRAAVSVSEAGVLVYRPGVAATADTELVWFSRTGERLGSVGSPLAYRGVELSPDGSLAAVHREEAEGNGDLWLLDLRRTSTTRATFSPALHNRAPVWSRDGRHLFFSRKLGDAWAIYQREASGVGGERLLYQGAAMGGAVAPMSVTPDSRFLVFYERHPETFGDLSVLSLDGQPEAKPYTRGPRYEDQAQVSPDGHWVAYTSNDSGRNQTFIQSFPSPDTRYQVSAEGGSQPRWRADGRELFYIGSAGQVGSNVGRVMAVSVTPARGELQLGTPEALFDSYVSVAEHQGLPFNYAVTPDGQRFLVVRQRVLSNSNPAATPLTVVLNWTSALPPR